MKKEVSCRALQVLFQIAEQKGLPRERLLAGVAYDEATLRDKHEHVEWETYCNITANLRPYLSDEDFEELGSEVIQTLSALPGASPVAKLLFNCADLYKWMNSKGGGPGVQLFA